MSLIKLPPDSMQLGSADRFYLRPDMALYVDGHHYTINGDHAYLAATAVPKPEPRRGSENPLILHVDPDLDTILTLGHEWELVPFTDRSPRLMVQRVDRPTAAKGRARA